MLRPQSHTTRRAIFRSLRLLTCGRGRAAGQSKPSARASACEHDGGADAPPASLVLLAGRGVG